MCACAWQGVEGNERTLRLVPACATRACTKKHCAHLHMWQRMRAKAGKQSTRGATRMLKREKRACLATHVRLSRSPHVLAVLSSQPPQPASPAGFSSECPPAQRAWALTNGASGAPSGSSRGRIRVMCCAPQRRCQPSDLAPHVWRARTGGIQSPRPPLTQLGRHAAPGCGAAEGQQGRRGHAGIMRMPERTCRAQSARAVCGHPVRGFA